MMYMWLSSKIVFLLLIILLCLITQSSQKESFINLKELNLFENGRVNYNKCRRKFRLGFKNKYDKIKRKLF